MMLETSTGEQHHINVYKSNQHYRVGDILLQQGLRWEVDRDVIISDPIYKNTVLGKYLQNSKDIFSPDILYNVVLDTIGNTTDNNTLYIHVRAGDVMMSVDGEEYKYYPQHRKKLHIYNHANLCNLVDTVVKQVNITRICIVTALHFGNCNINNRWKYTPRIELINKVELTKLINKIENKFNLPVYINPATSARMYDQVDNDIACLIYAKHAILDHGYFSEIIRSVRQHNL